jgi:hypothetical protein
MRAQLSVVCHRVRARAGADDDVYSSARGPSQRPATATVPAGGVPPNQLRGDCAGRDNRLRRGVHGSRRVAVLTDMTLSFRERMLGARGHSYGNVKALKTYVTPMVNPTLGSIDVSPKNSPAS